MSEADNPQIQLADEVAKCYHDPLRFVMLAYPWKEQGTPLAQHEGPDTWQAEVLREIGENSKKRSFDGVKPVAPLRVAIAKGHGIGGTTLLAWIVNWIMSTRPYAQGTVTANTFTQLETKTWATIQRWTKLCITAEWFYVGPKLMYHKEHRDSWFCSAQSCKEENSEAFAGQHAANSTSFYINDEDSAVPDLIHDVEEGGLTDGEPMIFLFGNPTRSQGKFYRAIFGEDRHRWLHRSIDSRESKFTNKEQIAEWIADYGEDSDFVRVRVRGLPPRASDAQFIDMERVLTAQKRHVEVFADEPLVAGCDLAWGGSDDNVIRFRCGLDARSIKPLRIPGEFTRDPQVLVNRLSDVLKQTYEIAGAKKRVMKLFLDSAGIAGPVGKRLRDLGFEKQIEEVNFGAHSPDDKYAYYRDYMWGQMKEWLLTGAIDSDSQLETDLVGPGVVSDLKQRVKLEAKENMKKRGLDSPDDGDALALTFAFPVIVESKEAEFVARIAAPVDTWRRGQQHGWMR